MAASEASLSLGDYQIDLACYTLFNGPSPLSQARRDRADDDHAEGVRDRILARALSHVPELGWTREAVSAGARDEGFPAVTSGLAATSPIDLVHFHARTANEELNALMAAEVQRLEEAGERLRIRKFIREQCEARNGRTDAEKGPAVCRTRSRSLVEGSENYFFMERNIYSMHTLHWSFDSRVVLFVQAGHSM